MDTDRDRDRVRDRVRDRDRPRDRPSVSDRPMGELLPTTSHSNFYSRVDQIAIFSHCQPLDWEVLNEISLRVRVRGRGGVRGWGSDEGPCAWRVLQMQAHAYSIPPPPCMHDPAW